MRGMHQALLAQYARKTVEGNGYVSADGCVHCYLPGLTVYGKAVRGRDPAPDAPVYPVFSQNGTVESGETGSAANIPLLRAVPDGSFCDAWDVSAGQITRNLKEWVFDGTEAWELYASRDEVRVFRLDHSGDINLAQKEFCSHYPMIYDYYNNSNHFYCVATRILFLSTVASLEDFKAFLAEQHAAGTPVTVWYVPAVPQTESVAAVKLIQQKGVTEIVQTGGTVANLPLKATFLRGS